MKHLVGLLIVVVACGVTPKQAGDDAKAACTLVQAFEASAVVDSICATAPELVELGAVVLASRADAGDAGVKVSACKPIPGPLSVCATNAETLAAIRNVKAAR